MNFGFTVCWWIGKRFQIWIKTCLKQTFPGGPSSETQRIMVKINLASVAIKIFHKSSAAPPCRARLVLVNLHPHDPNPEQLNSENVIPQIAIELLFFVSFLYN